MAGHISERRWSEVSDEAQRKLSKLLQFINECQALALNVEDLWAYHQNNSTDVAAQLFNTATPTAEQIQMADDLRNAFDGADKLSKQSEMTDMRKMV